MTKLRVMLVDDHPIVREGLRSLINSKNNMEVVGECSDGNTAVEMVSKLSPDLIVMDISMPGMNGIQATAAVKQIAPAVKVLALTVHEDQGYLQQLLAAGASGLVLKRAAVFELIHAIHSIMEGHVYLDALLTEKMLDKLQGQSLDSALRRTKLSQREENVLKLIAQGFSNKEIASHLSVSVKTVETYKTRSLEKLGLRSRADIVRYSVSQGWLNNLV
jgi:DNA-binding NarL/FixJ family response regulator